MTKRPPSITVISWIFITVGIVALSYHALHPSEESLVWVCFVRILAIVGGGFLLRGANWARWLLVVWLGYHVILSILHSAMAVGIHTVLLAAIAYFLFRPQSSTFFRQ